MERKTFLFITDTDYKNGNITGGHRRFLELIESVSRENDVILISGDIPQLMKGGIRHIGIEERKNFLPAHINRIITLSRVLRKEKKKIKYDYAISFGPADTISYKKSGYNNIVTLFRENFIGYKTVIGITGVKLWYFRLLEKYTVKNSEKIIVQCNDDKNALIERYGEYVKSKIYVQINNVNASWIVKTKVRKPKKNDRLVRIAFIGNFSDERKGQGILLPAVKKLVDDGYKIELCVVGDGKLLEKYKREYNECKNIVFLGRIKNAGELLAKSDFEVVPSLMDSCPNTVLEGLNAEIAVYGSNVGGIREILQDEEFLFGSGVDDVYSFIKRKIDEKKYTEDAIKQKAIKKRLTFDWGRKIENIIKNRGDSSV